MRRSPLVFLPFLCSCAIAPPGPVGLTPDTPPGSDATTASAPAQQPRGERPQNYIDMMFGTSYWDGLGGLDPTGVSPIPGRFGDFDRWGIAFDIGYDHVVWSNDKSDLTVGLETGWSSFGNSGSGLSSSNHDITASMSYLTPVVHWMQFLSPTVALVPGIGAGYYGFSIDEFETYYYGYWWSYDSRTLNRDDAFGGFLSLGLDVHLGPGSVFRLDNKLHFVEFNGLQSLMPNETDLNGPIYTFEIGFAFAF